MMNVHHALVTLLLTGAHTPIHKNIPIGASWMTLHDVTVLLGLRIDERPLNPPIFTTRRLHVMNW